MDIMIYGWALLEARLIYASGPKGNVAFVSFMYIICGVYMSTCMDRT